MVWVCATPPTRSQTGGNEPSPGPSLEVPNNNHSGRGGGLFGSHQQPGGGDEGAKRRTEVLRVALGVFDQRIVIAVLDLGAVGCNSIGCNSVGCNSVGMWKTNARQHAMRRG